MATASDKWRKRYKAPSTPATLGFSKNRERSVDGNWAWAFTLEMNHHCPDRSIRKFSLCLPQEEAVWLMARLADQLKHAADLDRARAALTEAKQ